MNRTLFALAAVAAASLATSQGAGIHTGLLNYWNLDGDNNDTGSSFAEGTGTVVDNGTFGGTAGAATYTTGLFGQAVDFERTVGTDGRVEIPDSADVVRAGTNLTISTWVQGDSTDTQQSNWQGLVVKGESTDYRLAHGNSADSIAYAGGIGDLQVASTLYTGGIWHHVVATTENGGEAKIYVDGVLGGTSAASAGITDNGSGSLFIGGNPDNPADRMFDGMIDDVAMWDRVLTQEEVSLIFSQGQSGTSLGAITVPEPASAILGFLGLGLALRRRR